MTALHLVTGIPWAIMEPTLKSIVEIADRVDVDLSNLEKWKVDSVQAFTGDYNREGGYHVRDGIAIVGVSGPIFRYANLMTDFSGASSLSKISKAFNAALIDRDVNGIILNIDSPGGQADGIAEFADMVRAGVSIKPVHAYIGGMGASAAYWIASAAQSVTIAKTGMAGSIGVVATIRDTKERDEKEGVKTLKFVSSTSPNKQLDPNTDEGAAEVQAIVDRLATEFVNAVADFRGVEPETVLQDFGQGGVMIGQDAVSAGLADAVGSFEGVLASMVPNNSVNMKGEINMSAENSTESVEATKPQTLTLESVKADHPEIAAALTEQGATAERERILGIEANSLPGHDDLIASFKADGKTTPEQAAVAILKAEKEKGATALSAIASAVETNADIDADIVDAQAGQKVVNDDDLPLEERCQHQWDSDPKIRTEFGGKYDQFLAFKKAEDGNRFKVITK